MGRVETEAIVLRTYDLGEADKIVVCLTRQTGVIRGVARGARRLKSRFGAGLEPFTLINLSYHEKEGRELVALGHVEIERSCFHLASRVEVVSAFAQMSEMLLAFAPPHEPDEKLFRMARACLEAIDESPEETTLVLRYFEIWMLRLAGFFSSVRACALCEARFSDGDVTYLDSELLQRCGNCGKGQGMAISGATRSEILAMQRQHPSAYVRSARNNCTANTLRELAEMTRRVIRHVLERDLQDYRASHA